MHASDTNCLFLVLLLLIPCIIFVWDTFKVHRINSIDDLKKILSTSTRPLTAGHCKLYNNTQFQCLPNVFIIGASKAGTTSLVNYLSHFPHVHFVERRITNIDHHKEVHRFDRATYERTWKSLELVHEWASSPIIDDPKDAVIHYTPHYLYAPTVPFDMRTFYPHTDDLQFLVMLRKPVDRMWSSYWFKNSYLFQGSDQGSLEDFLNTIQTQIHDR